MDQPTVSLCMIVRDEEAVIGRAIGSALPLVDEIIVCDTGSQDETVVMARSLGSRIVHHRWSDDFAAARNAALAEATSDWILVLDADEELDEVDPDRWGSLLADPAAAGYELTLVNTAGGQKQAFRLVRLFRNDPAVRYCYPVHEQIIPALNAWAARRGLQVLPSPLVIRHAGYGPEQRAAKRPRNRRLLAKAVREHPDEPYLHFQLGAESLSLLEDEVVPTAGMNAAAVSLERAWALAEDYDDREKLQRPWLADLAALLGSVRLTAGMDHAALDILRRGWNLFRPHPRLQFLYCRAAMATGELDPADIENLAAALAERPRHLLLGELRLRQGRPDEGGRHYRQVLAVTRDDTRALLGLACCLRDQQRPREALGLFLRAVSANQWNWRAWREGARLMRQQGLSDQARSWSATFAEHFPDHPDNAAGAVG